MKLCLIMRSRAASLSLPPLQCSYFHPSHVSVAYTFSSSVAVCLTSAIKTSMKQIFFLRAKRRASLSYNIGELDHSCSSASILTAGS